MLIDVAAICSPECRFGNAAVSTINTNKKTIAKLHNKETDAAYEGQQVEATGNTVGGKRDEGKQNLSMKKSKLGVCNSR
jgi:hypothetical protein